MSCSSLSVGTIPISPHTSLPHRHTTVRRLPHLSEVCTNRVGVSGNLSSAASIVPEPSRSNIRKASCKNKEAQCWSVVQQWLSEVRGSGSHHTRPSAPDSVLAGRQRKGTVNQRFRHSAHAAATRGVGTLHSSFSSCIAVSPIRVSALFQHAECHQPLLSHTDGMNSRSSQRGDSLPQKMLPLKYII